MFTVLLSYLTALNRIVGRVKDYTHSNSLGSKLGCSHLHTLSCLGLSLSVTSSCDNSFCHQEFESPVVWRSPLYNGWSEGVCVEVYNWDTESPHRVFRRKNSSWGHFGLKALVTRVRTTLDRTQTWRVRHWRRESSCCLKPIEGNSF